MAADFVYLASGSPRRRELLQQIGVPFQVLEVAVDETVLAGEAPRGYVARLAAAKADAGWRERDREASARPVLAADTAVVLDGEILGKPKDRQDAECDAAAAVGPHPRGADRRRAGTGGRHRLALSRSEVTFRGIAAAEARAYWDTGEPRDKAGGYAIQGRGAVFVAELRGSYSGVMGLPLYETAELLSAAGVPRWRAAERTRMSTEILINASTHEARAAVVENGVLQEVFLERASRRGLISNIYKGRVSRVLPGMQAAFIEIGMERTAFLHASDIFDPRHADTGIEPPRTENIRALVAEGQRDPGAGGQGSAGHQGRAARPPTSRCRRAIWCTCRKGRGVGVSARIEDEAERERLRAAVLAGRRAGRERGLHRAHRGGGCAAGGACGPTWCTCASCGSSCARRACAPSPATWCMPICRCICACCAICCGPTSSGC